MRPITPTFVDGNISNFEQDLYDIHFGGVSTDPPTISADDSNTWDDWSLARSLQALEFEISNEMIEGYEGDFNEKEYHASRSCKRQLLTISAFICLVQVLY